MKYATTVGVELTFVPGFLEEIHDELDAVEANPTSKRRGFIESVMTAHNRVCAGMATMLAHHLINAGIPYFKCHADPGCVEVPTNAYTTEATLAKAVRQIMNAAGNYYLEPVSRHICGKGAHVHMGNPKHAPKDFQRRMMVWANANPWAAWAFADVNDDDNAEPVPATVVFNDDDNCDSLSLLLSQIESRKGELVTHERTLHRLAYWTESARRESTERKIANSQKKIRRLRKDIARKSHGLPKVEHLNQVHRYEGKDYFVSCREKTTEFRMFSMTEDVEGILRNVKFANAVYAHVVAQDTTTFAPRELVTRDQLEAMKYGEAARGFNRMLDTLGLDRDEFRDARAHIALPISRCACAQGVRRHPMTRLWLRYQSARLWVGTRRQSCVLSLAR